MRKSSVILLIGVLLFAATPLQPATAKSGPDCNFSMLDLDFTKMLSVEFGRISLSVCDVVAHREKILATAKWRSPKDSLPSAVNLCPISCIYATMKKWAGEKSPKSWE